MIIPLLLIILAGLSAGAVAYGTYPIWMKYPHGLEIILWSRRLQWPLVSLSLIACIILIGLAISGRRRAWWLIGLAPVLALFAHRFATGPAAGRMNVVENPAFVSVAEAKVPDEEWVVGITFGDTSYAYPYSSLFATPVVLQADHEKRMILMWSAFANRALAMPIGQELRAHDLDIVSTPANALLLYNSRRGEFINALTGQTPAHERPKGFSNAAPLRTVKMPMGDWRAMHPDTKVLARNDEARGPAPTQPIQPFWPMPPTKLDKPADTRVAVIGVMKPIAVESSALTAAPLIDKADDTPVVVFREQPDAPVRAFDRRTYDKSGTLDQIVNFAPNLNHKRHPNAFFVDVGSNTGWSAAGICVDAPTDAKQLKGKRLQPVDADDALAWGVMKFWYPDLQIKIPPAAPIAVESENEAESPTKRPPHRKPKKPKPSGTAGSR